MPPPMTSILFGCVRSSSAPVESTMRGSSGRNGSRTDCEPAAMIAWSNFTTFFAPSGSATSRWCGSTNVPTPVTTSTLRILAMPARPPVSLPTTLSLCARSFARSTLGARERHAEVGEVRGLVDHRRDVQQRLRRDAADVQAHAAERRVALDEHRLHAEVGGAERGGIAARAGRRGPASSHSTSALPANRPATGAGVGAAPLRAGVGADAAGRSRRRGRRGGGVGRRLRRADAAASRAPTAGSPRRPRRLPPSR